MKNKAFFFIVFLFVITSCKKELSEKEAIVEVNQFVLPVLKGKEFNKVLSFNLVVKKDNVNSAIKNAVVSLAGTTNKNDIKKVTLFYGNESFEKATVIKEITSISEEIKILIDKKGDEDATFWLSIELNDNADISNKIAATIKSLTLSDGNSVKIHQKGKESKYIGIALKQKNEKGVHTFRIPGLATTNKGTLIAVYDIRYNGSVDLQADIDVGMNRSTDGGQTWEPMKVIMDMGEYGGKPQDENGIGDPTVLVDRKTNTIWVAALWLNGSKDKRAWWASQEGMSAEKTGQFILVKSEDDGKTWSEPINITSQIKEPKWKLFFNGPGKGITMKNGTLVFPAQYKDENGIPFSTIICSKDRGKTWKVGTGVKSETTEAQVVELLDGSIMINARDDRNRASRKDSKNGRTVAITKDLGKTWQEHSTSRKSLIEPNCMASIISVETTEKGNVLFFSNPNSKTKRNHITIKASFDEGATWNSKNQIELYEENTFGYSCMTLIGQKYIGILYEGNRELYFQKIPIKNFINH